MAKHTFTTAYVELEKRRQELNDAENDYIYITEKILKRDLFDDKGHLIKHASMSSISKLELSIAYNKLQKCFVKYIGISQLTEKLRKDLNND